MLECPLLSNKFLSLIENGVGSLKSFFQLDHQVDVSIYLKRLTHSTTLQN